MQLFEWCILFVGAALIIKKHASHVRSKLYILINSTIEVSRLVACC